MQRNGHHGVVLMTGMKGMSAVSSCGGHGDDGVVVLVDASCDAQSYLMMKEGVVVVVMMAVMKMLSLRSNPPVECSP